MNHWYMLTLVGRDRPGIVAKVTAALFDGGCNLGEASMMRLAEAESRMEFLPDAATELYQITGGVPALINRVADLALVTAQAAETNQVDVESVRSAAQELRPCDDAAIVTFSVDDAMRRRSA